MDKPVLKKIKDKAEYEVELKECKIKIGGKDANTCGKFVPNLNMSRWSDECWLNMNHLDVVDLEEEEFKDEKIELKVGNKIHRYSLVDGILAYEVVFACRPLSDQVEFDLNFPDGLQFVLQPKLTREQIDFGGVMPEDVEGGYAVYWMRVNNKYESGKFCHIYRPRLIDNRGARIWAMVEIIGKKMVYKMDGSWLDNAYYPVSLG